MPDWFEWNHGTAYVPFIITNRFGRPTPAQFIQVHMTDNPYIVAQLTADGPSYCGELHATAITDIDAPPEVLTDDTMRMFAPNFLGAGLISDALKAVGDRSLTAEVRRHQGYIRHIDRLGA